MQQKRMISKEIVGSDAFHSMSNEAQLLYFQLVMNADNRGYINNALCICSAFVNIGSDCIDELVKARFILDRGNGVYLIKHWYIHNEIPTRFIDESKYVDDLEKIYFDNNYSYTTRETKLPVMEIIKRKKPLKETKLKGKENENQNEIKSKLKINNSKGQNSKDSLEEDINSLEYPDDDKPF